MNGGCTAGAVMGWPSTFARFPQAPGDFLGLAEFGKLATSQAHQVQAEYPRGVPNA